MYDCIRLHYVRCVIVQSLRIVLHNVVVVVVIQSLRIVLHYIVVVVVVVQSLRIVLLAVSLGGVESLVEHPASMTHGTMIMTVEERRASHIADGHIRLR